MSSFFHHHIPFNSSKTSIIVMAAGASRRLGRPKQLVHYQGKPLLSHVLEQAFFAKCQSVFLVLGANRELILPKVKYLPVEIVINEDWEAGMGTSIASGIKAVQKKHPNTQGVVLLITDQPFVTGQIIGNLIHKATDAKTPIVAAHYGENVGVPAYFNRCLFPKLAQLEGQKGAKKIILEHLSDTMLVPFPEGAFDVDTEADYQRLKEWESSKLKI